MRRGEETQISEVELHVFIISWRGQNEKAALIEDAVRPFAEHTTVIFSDHDDASSERLHWHFVPDEYYYGMKRKTALDLHLQTPSAVLLEIQADNIAEDWTLIPLRAREVFTNHPDTGAWMPNVLELGWTRRKAQLGTETSDGLVPAMLLDPSCWAVHPIVVGLTREADYQNNKFGWGIGWLVALRALTNGMPIYWDANLQITQPKGAGYSHTDAREQARQYLSILKKRERFVKKQIEKIVRLRKQRARASQNALELRLRVKFLRTYLKLFR
jgi:hypothetical protein